MMDRLKAKNVLVLIDRINREIDLLGKILINNQMKPVPIKVTVHNKRKFQ